MVRQLRLALRYVQTANVKKVIPYTIIFAVVVLLWLVFCFGLQCWIPSSEERGRFGDQFGGANALFTGLAFAGVIVTLLAQHRENKRQTARFQQELEERRDANRGEQQRFEQEMANRNNEFSKQITLGALTAKLELFKELWQHCERQKAFYRTEKDQKQFDEWAGNARKRYDLMMEALDKVNGLMA
jgi:hypothetical protein